jgi:hypothetical protein
MAPIYLAKKVATTTKGPNLFMSKGIVGYSPSTVSSLAIVGLPHERQIAYGAYAQNVDAFIYATSRKTRILTDRDGYPDFEMGKKFEMSLPTITFSPSFPVKPDQEEAIVRKLGEGTIKTKIGKTVVYNLIRPTAPVS